MTRARNIADIVSGNFDIPAGSLDNAVPADGSITTAKLADDAVTSAKIADGATPVSGFRNLLINGKMDIAQRKSGAFTVSNNTNEGYSIVDRWALNFNNGMAGAITYDHSTDAPDGFSRSAKLQCSTTTTTFSTNHYVEFRQRIEGQNLQHLAYGTSNGKQMTFSWYMKAVSHSSPITVRFRTLDGTTEYYAKSYTPTTSWARYTCVIPASATATMDDDAGAGFEVAFVLAAASGSGSAASSDSTAWTSARINHRDDIGNFLNSTNNVIFFTGCQLEVNDTSTPTEFEHRFHAQELALCQRYFQKWDANNASYDFICLSYGLDGDDVIAALHLPVPMRAQPSLSVSNCHVYAASGGNAETSGLTFNGYGMREDGSTFTFNVDTDGSPALSSKFCYPIGFKSVSDGYLRLDCELG